MSEETRSEFYLDIAGGEADGGYVSVIAIRVGEEKEVSGDSLGQAIEILLSRRANRLLNNTEYLDHIKKCVAELQLSTFEEAFLFGALDAMIQDFASAEQMNLPPGNPIYDPGCRANRFERLKAWKQTWDTQGRIPFKKNL